MTRPASTHQIVRVEPTPDRPDLITITAVPIDDGETIAFSYPAESPHEWKVGNYLSFVYEFEEMREWFNGQ